MKTTLCYIESAGKFLMLFRNKKENDCNEGKWIGVGGKLEAGEEPLDGVMREVCEETGFHLSASAFEYKGIIYFRNDEWEDEDMYLFTARADDELSERPLPTCDEGKLAWIEKDKVLQLPSWKGDRAFLKEILRGSSEINMSLIYRGGELENVIPGKAQAWCRHNGKCGGCTYGAWEYERQLEEKGEALHKLLLPVMDEASVWEGMVPAPLQTRYKNKMEYSFGDEVRDGELTLGMHRRKSFYSVLPCDDCFLVHEDYNQIVAATREFFAAEGVPFLHKNHEGYLRHLMLRRSFVTGDIMVVLVTAGEGLCPEAKKYDALLDEWRAMLIDLPLEGQISGILHTRNDALSDAVVDQGTELLWGRDYIEESLFGLRFKITPYSFFQTSSKGAEALYGKVREYVGDTAGQVVYDLYCGTGTIAQIVAPAAKKAYGVEIIAEAVEAAKENAALNGLTNCEFLAGDVLEVLSSAEGGTFEKPDVIILDPPRDGLHPKMLPVVTAYGVKNIVYVACKPASFVRDMEAFAQAGYRIAKVCGVDEFPWTAHVECVVLLSKHS